MTEQVENIQQEKDEYELVAASSAPEQAEAEQPIEEVEQPEQAEQADEVDEVLLIEDDEVSPTSDAEPDSEEDLPEDAPNWAKKLRQQYKEVVRENKQLKQQSQPQAAFVADEFTEPEPTEEDVDYDIPLLKKKYAEWLSRKNAHAEQQKAAKTEAEALQAQYREKLNTYNERKQTVAKKFADYDKAEKTVIDTVPVQVQNAILMYSDAPELLVLVAGRKPEIRERLTRLANDPVALGVEIGKLSKSVKSAPKPKAQVAATPQVKAGSVKPKSADERRFTERFPDAVFKSN